jgi:hypothetical protein
MKTITSSLTIFIPHTGVIGERLAKQAGLKEKKTRYGECEAPRAKKTVT